MNVRVQLRSAPVSLHDEDCEKVKVNCAATTRIEIKKKNKKKKKRKPEMKILPSGNGIGGSDGIDGNGGTGSSSQSSQSQVSGLKLGIVRLGRAAGKVRNSLNCILLLHVSQYVIPVMVVL